MWDVSYSDFLLSSSKHELPSVHWASHLSPTDHYGTRTVMTLMVVRGADLDWLAVVVEDSHLQDKETLSNIVNIRQLITVNNYPLLDLVSFCSELQWGSMHKTNITDVIQSLS